MSELRDPTRESLAETVRALVKRHGGPTAVGDLVGAHRLTVNRWMKGDIGIDKLGLLAEKLDEPITVHFGPDTETEAAEPSWVQRLEARLIDLRENQERVAKIAARGVVTALGDSTREAWADRIAERWAESPTQSDEASEDRTEPTVDPGAGTPEGQESA